MTAVQPAPPGTEDRMTRHPIITDAVRRAPVVITRITGEAS